MMGWGAITAPGGTRSPRQATRRSATRTSRGSVVGNPISGAFERRPGSMLGAPDRGASRGHLELAVDRVLDQRYRVREPLGAGGSSQVYLAEDTALRREVAIKILDPNAAADGTLRKNFVREARALAQMSHPHVVAVHDVGEVDGLPFIVMEHLTGASLKQRIERDGALPVEEAVRLAIEIANGLTFAHQRGIVHADLKPSNVLLDEDGHAKICDFGIARTPQETAETPQLFATALYVAPERVEGKAATPATDVYGLGLVLYEMLVGKPPFTSSNPAVLLRDHVVRQPVPPSHLRPSLPKELDSIVMKALAKSPALRYSRASDVAHALARLENIGTLGTIRVREDTAIMSEPLQGFVPDVKESPVVALLQAYGGPLRNAFFAVLAALPVFGLLVLADFGIVGAALGAGLVAILGLAGQLGFALALAWVIETIAIFLFVPGLAILFAFVGLWVWLRDVPAERSALALAMPVTAPFGFGPALVLMSATIHGISGVVTAAWGAVMTVVFAIAVGKQSMGAYVQTGLGLEQASLFDPVRAIETKSAILNAVLPRATSDRFGPLLEELAPERLIGQMSSLVSRISGADVSAIATVLAWTMAALVVWTVTRLLRTVFDALLRRRDRWFALYVFATAAGVTAGAALLYMLYVTWAPLDLAVGRPSDSVLFLAALVGAIVALAAGVVIAATETPEVEEEPAPAMNARRIPVR